MHRASPAAVRTGPPPSPQVQRRQDLNGSNETITIGVNRLLDFLRQLEDAGPVESVDEIARLTVQEPVEPIEKEEPEEDCEDPEQDDQHYYDDEESTAEADVAEEMVSGALPKHPKGSHIIEIRAVKITPILNRIEKYRYTDEDLHTLDDYADPDKYKNAGFFQQQVIFSFYKLVQNQLKFNPKIMTFE